MIERLRARLSGRFPPGGRARRVLSLAATWLFFLLLPFVVMWRFAPFVSPSTIGNDYVLFPIEDPLELSWCWRHGLVPMFLPGYAGGASAATMTLGQAWHPITWLSILTPGHGSGNAENVATMYRCLEVGITHRILYRETRAVGLGRLPAFVLTFAMVFNERMLDSFRYGASLESYSGMLFACAVFSAAWREGWTPGRVAWGAATIYLTLVGGHPQWALFGVTGACLFAAGLLTRPSPGDPRKHRVRFVGGVALAGVLGAVLALGYLLPFSQEFMKENAARVDQDYAFTIGYSDTLRGSLASFTRPLEADVHGAFGSTSWPLILVASVPVALVALRRPLPIVLPTIASILAFLFMINTTTPFHRWVVEHVPLFSSFRVPGRASLWLPPMFLLIGWTTLADLDRAELRRSFVRGPVVAWAAGLAIALHVAYQLVLPNIRANGFSPLFLSSSPGWVDAAIAAALGVTSTTVVLLASSRPKVRATAWTLALLGTVGSASLALPYGTWRNKRRPSTTLEQMDAHHAKHLVFLGDAGFGLEAKVVARAKEAKLPLVRPAGVLVDRWSVADDDEAALKLAVDSPEATFLVGPGVADRTRDGDPPPKEAVTVRSINWNVWRFGVDAPDGGAFVFGQPNLPQWRATVDGQPAEIATANGTFPAVMLTPGQHEIEMRFVSRATIVGASIFFAMLLAGIGVRHAIATKGRTRDRVVSALLAVVLLALAGLWYRSLWPDFDVRSLAKPAVAKRPPRS